MRWLVLGSRGMFGSDMLAFLKAKNEDATGFNSDQLDLREDKEKIHNKIKDFDVVINATAYTNVNLAEKDQDQAFELNALIPAKLAEITSNNNQRFLHISTDYVFDGNKGEKYLTTDTPNPLNFYGQSKLSGEQEIAKNNPNALIIRTSWLYGPNGNCFPKAIINKLLSEDSLEVVDDQFGTPTSTWFLREFCYNSIKNDFAGGIYHGVPKGLTSWHGFANLIARDFNVEIKSIASDKQAVIRPANSQLKPHESTTETWQQCWEEIKQEFLKTTGG